MYVGSVIAITLVVMLIIAYMAIILACVFMRKISIDVSNILSRTIDHNTYDTDRHDYATEESEN